MQAALASGDAALLTRLVLDRYGRELMSFVSALHRSQADAEEVFSLTAEAIWRSAPTFERRSSVRTWCYAIARRTSLHHRRDARRRAKRFRPFEDQAELAQLEQRVRTETLTYLRTERREKLAALRDALPERDRELLMLRIDRRMSWSDIALVIDEATPGRDASEIVRRAARLRKQFQVLKDRLRETARSQGLLGAEDDVGAR